MYNEPVTLETAMKIGRSYFTERVLNDYGMLGGVTSLLLSYIIAVANLGNPKIPDLFTNSASGSRTLA